MEANRRKTLHPAYRVTDLDMSLGFYTALGYQLLGRVDLGDGATLTVLKFPDEPVGTLELVHRPADGAVQLGTGFSHLAVQVDDLAGARQTLIAAGLVPAPEQQPGGPDGPPAFRRAGWVNFGRTINMTWS
jgi:lactoylglutathione lyase